MELVKSTILSTLPASERAALREAGGRGRFVGIARQSPVMQNGQLPGIRRQYNTAYAEVLEFIINRFGSVAR